MKRIISIVIILTLLVYGSAAAIDLTRDDGQITFVLKHNGTILSNVNLSLFRVADVDNEGRYTLVSDFAESQVDLNVDSIGDREIDAGKNRELSQRLVTYASDKSSIQRKEGTTNSEGRVVFDGLTPGMYLVVQRNDEGANGYKMYPALIPLPVVIASDWSYSVVSEPKIEPPTPPSPTPTTSPSPPTTPTRPPGTPRPTPRPSPTPQNPGNILVPEGDGFTEIDPDDTPLGNWGPDPGGDDEWIFTPFPPLANLPQTGQLRWPIPVLASLGMLMTIAGVIMVTRRKKLELVAALARLMAQDAESNEETQ